MYKYSKLLSDILNFICEQQLNESNNKQGVTTSTRALTLNI